MLVRFNICFVAAACKLKVFHNTKTACIRTLAAMISAHTKYLAPSSGFYFAPNPIDCLYGWVERETTIWRVAQKTALARGKLQRKSLLALQIPAINSTAGVQHGVAAPPLLYSRRATVLVVSFVISTYLVAYLPSSPRVLLLESISRVSAVRIVPASAEASANQPVFDHDCHEPRPPHDSPGSPNHHRPNFRPKRFLQDPRPNSTGADMDRGTSVLLITLTNIRSQLTANSTTVTVGRWLHGGGNKHRAVRARRILTSSCFSLLFCFADSRGLKGDQTQSRENRTSSVTRSCNFIAKSCYSATKPILATQPKGEGALTPDTRDWVVSFYCLMVR